MADSGTEKLFQPIGSVVEHAVAAPNEADTEEESSTPSNITREGGGDIMAVKSLCMACEETGTTRLLLTRIPFFRDVIIMSFECEHCGYRNSEVQSAEVQEKGCRFEVRVETADDLNRQLVKGERASVLLKELEFEIPAGTQGGVFTTIEGLLDRAIESLDSTQALRRAVSEEDAAAVEAFLVKLRAYRNGEVFPFTLILEDPSGNSFLENPAAPHHDPRMKVRYFTRNRAQNEALGLFAGNTRDGAMAQIAEGEEGEEGAEEGAAASGGGGAGGGAGAAEGAEGADHEEAPEETEGDDTALAGSGAQTVFPSKRLDQATALAAQYKARALAAHGGAGGGAGGASAGVSSGIRRPMKDMSGNVPGGFKKGGALIRTETDRSRATDTSVRGGTIRDSAGKVASVIFESSASQATKEVLRFPSDCFNCSAPGEVLMCITDVPHFKEVILMSFACDECGWKNVEVKGGGAVPDHGTRTELRYTPGQPWSEEDMTRDVIKSDTAAVDIPELDLHLDHGSLGGLYTTVEGLLNAIKERLLETDPFGAEAGDSGDKERQARMREFIDKLDARIAGSAPFTLILTDPMANTWVYSPAADRLGPDGQPQGPAADPRLSHTAYKRSEEEDADLGLLDMNAPREEEGEEEAAAAAGGAGAGAAATATE